jgi:flagellar biosynthesis component FlhA
MFQYSAINGWYYMDDLWPGFLLGPGLGFLFMYLLGNREKGLLIPAFILIVLAILFGMDHDVYRFFWPAILIVLGIYLLLKNRRRSELKEQKAEDIQPPKTE